jgi:hypothetical protein
MQKQTLYKVLNELYFYFVKYSPCLEISETKFTGKNFCMMLIFQKIYEAQVMNVWHKRIKINFAKKSST